jgi:hypothetical protein
MKKVFLYALLFSASLFASCRETPNSDELSLDPFELTLRDTSVNFGKFTTFALNDSIGIVSDDPLKDGDKVSQARANKVLDQVRSVLTSRGYTEVEINENPDFLVSGSALEYSVDYTVMYPGSWWGYGGYYGGAWGGYYPYYPPYYGGGAYGTTYSYQVGSLVLEMVTVNEITDKGAVIWTGLSGAILDGTSDNKIVNSVNQLFIQSPYITR